jgi:fatty acid desaturase
MSVDEDTLRKQARERVQKRRDLGAHAVAYVVFNAALVGIWAVTGAGYFWPAWVMLAWAVGLVLNVWDVFFRRPVTDADVDREIGRMRGGT